MVVSLHESYIIWFFRVKRNSGKVHAVDLGGGESGAKMVGDGAGAAAHIENSDWVFYRGMEDFAEHHLLYEFMLSIESLMFACADFY